MKNSDSELNVKLLNRVLLWQTEALIGPMNESV